MTLTLEQLKKAWDKTIRGRSIGCAGCSRDSDSFNALLGALVAQKKRKLAPKRKGAKK